MAISRSLTPDSQEQWQPILHASNQVVLYNPRSHALSITSTAAARTQSDEYPPPVISRRIKGGECPYCKQSLPLGFRPFEDDPFVAHRHRHADSGSSSAWDSREIYELSSTEGGGVEGQETEGDFETLSTDPAYHSRASDYFQLLAIANERSMSREPNPPPLVEEERPTEATNGKTAFPHEKMVEGYFKAFFQEEYRLGMGANGSVYLCQHVLDGNTLGHFAVKKIAVGESHSYLIKILREVQLLEKLHHPNIITYHHAWLESSQFSSFGPSVPTLHVLMQWAEGGSLDDFIDIRLGRKPAHVHMHPYLYSTSQPPSMTSTPLDEASAELGAGLQTPTPKNQRTLYTAQGQDSPSAPQDAQSRKARIKAFRAYQRAPPEEKERMKKEMEAVLGVKSTGREKEEWTAVHLLSADEVKSLFRDVVEGLGFLHDKSILHLDLKPGNVLLTWDEGKLIPRAMLSDFGTSRDMIDASRDQRSGNTGTLEYAAPETLPSPQTGLLQQIDSKADMWSMGMILHKLLFFKLPYRYAAEGDANGQPVSRDLNGEGDKLRRLEREVLNYSGFKTTGDMVSSFEGRRLPRSFLVLLENLLHPSSSARPSCLRVANAIKDGKFDPLTESPKSNLPVASRSRGGSEGVSGPSSPPLLSTSSPASLSSFQQNQQEQQQRDRTRLLALPSPLEVLGPEEEYTWQSSITNLVSPGKWKRWLLNVVSLSMGGKKGKSRRERGKSVDGYGVRRGPPRKRSVHLQDGIRMHRTMGSANYFSGTAFEIAPSLLTFRLFKSCLLVGKVLTLPWVCPDPLTYPRPGVTAVLLGLAVMDSVINWNELGSVESEDEDEDVSERRWGRGLLVSCGLALVHVGVVWFGGRSGSGGEEGIEGWVGRACCLPLESRTRSLFWFRR